MIRCARRHSVTVKCCACPTYVSCYLYYIQPPVSSECCRLQTLQAGPQRREVTARLLLDCMGHYSPIVKQMRGGAKPEGMVLVVGTCADGVPAERNRCALQAVACTRVGRPGRRQPTCSGSCASRLVHQQHCLRMCSCVIVNFPFCRHCRVPVQRPCSALAAGCRVWV